MCNCGGVRNCMHCGIAEPAGREEKKYCYKYKKYISGSDLTDECNCGYFISYQYKEDEILTAMQHLMLKEMQQSSGGINH